MAPSDLINLLINDITQLRLDPATGVLSVLTQPKKKAGAEELTLALHFSPQMARQLFEKLLDAQRLMASRVEGTPLTDALH